MRSPPLNCLKTAHDVKRTGKCHLLQCFRHVPSRNSSHNIMIVLFVPHLATSSIIAASNSLPIAMRKQKYLNFE
ncbi:hypothetical protein CAEBREN_04633 [Caenorhabditis brenneri]|uniref:Uncharacterized protein n=1 Tax=Caenorhabditis brenneri TaxID=135651 RepID=G0MH82_CAEBE|nr:hypothetical protein CAEBREN_04633 [Caenorhabditis brenneri]